MTFRKFQLALSVGLTLLLVGPAHGQIPGALEQPPLTRLQSGRASLVEARYDDAVRSFESIIKAGKPDPRILRDAYLYLILTWVYKSRSFEFDQKNPDSLAASVFLDKARNLVAECLQTPSLRHTEPTTDPAAPLTMVHLFKEARQRLFGSLRITKLDPPTAEVSLAGEVLTPVPGVGGVVAGVDIPVGRSLVIITAPGYQTLSDPVDILAGKTADRAYRLKKKHGALWYSSRFAVLAAATYAGKRIIWPPTPPETPLPSPPDPPKH